MRNLVLRVWFTAALMVVGWLCTSWVRAGYTFEVQPLSRDLESLPLDMKDYRGKDVPLAEGVREILKADSVINREYRKFDGTNVVLHVSAWTRPESMSSAAPHVPKLCYTNAGYKILEERSATISNSSRSFPITLILCDRDGERCVVAYWYRMGDSYFNTISEARNLHRQYWGKRTWPPTLKILVQIPAQDIDSALPEIERFGAAVSEFTGQM